MSYSTAQPFDPSQWREVEGFDFTDITYHRHVGDTRADGTVRIAFDRPEAVSYTHLTLPTTPYV